MSDTSHSHSYGTRIKNKPSARLRHTPPPRRIKPARHPSQPPTQPANYPLFPLPNVLLHPEDASSKVFHAIGRCFLSVDNRAMTIKDLAEMTLKFGLMCQNVSAASQAITTYIRNHLARCEAQQDQPLLLRHFLSGTPADDDLVAALHSRVGGAPLQRQPSPTDSTPNIPPGRHTNFRRGTIVWYLSKASGVSCPFARARVLLSNYSSTPASNPKPRNTEKCGEKRKRLITRHHRSTDRPNSQSPSPAPSSSPVDSGYAESPSPSSEEEEEEEDEQHERPPKVKLTLRLRPSPACPNPDIIDLSNETSSSDEDEDEQDIPMSSPDTLNPEPFCLPPYPRRSITVPSYTPVSPPTRTSLQYVFPQPAMESASPPPDSDHEEEGEFDFDFSSDDEESRVMKADDVDEGLGLGPGGGIGVGGGGGVSLKEKNVRDMLEAWEDLDLDRARSFSTLRPDSSPRENEKQHHVDEHAAREVKVEELEMWEWEFESGWAGAQGEVEVKKEDKDAAEVLSLSLLPSRGLSLSPSPSPWSAYPYPYPLSPMSPLTPSTPTTCSSTFHSPPLSYSTGVFSTSPIPDDSPSRWTHAHTRKPSLERKKSVLNWQDAELLGPDSVHITELEMEIEWAGRKRAPVEVSAASPLASSSNAAPPISEDADMADPEPIPEHTEQEQEREAKQEEEEVVVVHTCVPCDPPVSATQVEGIPVYQTTLPHAHTTRVLLRRLDTDFVNLAPLLAVFSSSHSPLSSSSSSSQSISSSFCPTFHPSAVHVDHPNPSVCGPWVPLSIARQFLAQSQSPCPNSVLRASVDVFLSDELVMRFPSALRDFWRVSKPGRMLGQFGVCFGGGVVRPLHSRHRDYALASTSSSSRSESHPPPCSESHPSSSSQLPTCNNPISPSSDKHHSEDTWILCEEPIPIPESEPVLPLPSAFAFDIALAELSSGLGSGLGVAASPPGPGGVSDSDSGGAEPPLSPTEAEMFRVLCICPDWEEKDEEGEEESTDHHKGADVDVDVDVDIDIDIDGDVDVDVEAVEEEPEPELELEPRSSKDGRSLRRSKRVADAAARTRTRRTRGPTHA